MNRKVSKRSCRKKIIPLHFKKEKKPSLSDLLKTASYKRRVRELLNNNKALASALQEAQCMVSSNNMLLKNYARDSNQILLAKMKVKDMATTIQKLVGDLNDVIKCLDVSCVKSVIRPFTNDDVRMRIQEPDLEKIDESGRSSLGQESTQIPRREMSLSQMETTVDLNLAASSSFTEIYNVQELLKNYDKSKDPYQGREETAEVQSEVHNQSEAQSPPTPQLILPPFTSSRNLSITEQEQPQNSLSERSTVPECVHPKIQSSKVASNSKIPVRKQNLFPEAFNQLDSPVPCSQDNRRGTFVVTKCNEQEETNFLLASDRRGTFTLSEVPPTTKSNTERRETFVAPTLPPPPDVLKPVSKFHQFSAFSHQVPPDICADDRTVHLSEDMDLTEIIPSVSAISGSLQSKDSHNHLANLYLPSVSGIKDIQSVEVLPFSLKINKQLSPIEKVSKRPDFKKDCAEHEVALKPETLQLINSEISLKNTEEIVKSGEMFSELSTASKKSILPSFLSFPECSSRRQHLPADNTPLNIIDIESNSVVDLDKTFVNGPLKNLKSGSSPKKDSCSASSQLETLNNSPRKSKRQISNVPSRKSKISEAALNSSSSDPVSSDSDPDFIAVTKLSPAKRIPGRKSLKPNRRGPFIFKNNLKGSKLDHKINELGEVDSHLTDAKGKYDFSSSESEDENIKKSKSTQRLSKKRNSKATKSKKEKSTVALLEQDINLMYQDQSRKKRSLKRKVSFANVNLSPVNSEIEEESKPNDVLSNETKKCSENVINLPTEDQPVRICVPRRSILKKSRPSTITCEEICPLSDKIESPLESIHEKRNEPPDFKSSSENLKTFSEKKCSNKFTKQFTEADGELLTTGTSSASAKSKVNSEKESHKPKSISNSESKSASNKKTSSNSEKSVKTSKLQRNVLDKLSRKNSQKDKNSVQLQNFQDTTPGQKNSSEKKTTDANVLTTITDEKPGQAVSNSPSSDSSFIIAVPNASTENENSETKSATVSIPEEGIESVACKKSKNSHRESELDDKLYTGSKSKRTFSGVSERTSKKRFTGDDDFLGDVDTLQCDKGSLPVHNTRLSIQLKSDTSVPVLDSEDGKNILPVAKDSLPKDSEHKEENKREKLKKNVLNTKSSTQLKVDFPDEKSVPPMNKLDDATEVNVKTPSNSKTKKTVKAKARRTATVDVLNEVRDPILNSRQNEHQDGFSEEMLSFPRPSEARKTTSTDSIASLKENLVVPGLESGGRSRRTRPPISLKEPSSKKKLRR